MSAPWNACPACGKLVPVSEHDADGAELTCDGCNVGLVVSGFGNGRKLEFMPCDDDEDHEPHAGVCGGGE